MKKLLTGTASGAAIGLLLWVLLSWLNTVAVNCTAGSAVAAWNLFSLVF